MTDGHMEGNLYVTDYIDGQEIETLFYACRNDAGEFVKKARELLEAYFMPDKDELTDFVFTDEYRNLFGKVYVEGAKCLGTTNIDLIFSNLRLTEKGEMFCIDNEWVFDFPIPYEYTIWRAVTQLYGKYMIYLRNKISRNDFLKAVGLNEKNFAAYCSMEKNFADNVSGYDYRIKYRKASMMCKMLLN